MCLSCDPSKRLCDGTQLMDFVCCSLSCQTMFRVVSDWLHSLSVFFGRVMNTDVLVLSKLFSTKPGSTVFFFANQELLQHRVRGFGSFRETAIQHVVHIGRDHGDDSKRGQRRQDLLQRKIELFTRVLQSKPQSSSCIFGTIDGNTRGQNHSACNSFFWKALQLEYDSTRFNEFLVLEECIRS